jgi:hypothetical protein
MEGAQAAREYHIMYCMLLNRFTVDKVFIFGDVASCADRLHCDG